MRFTKLKWLAAICATAIIAGCGGGSDGDGNSPADQAPPPPANSTDHITGTGTVELAANTYVVPQSVAAASTLTGDTFTVPKTQAKVYKKKAGYTTEDRVCKPGDILITDAHGGRVMQIVGVQETATEIRYQWVQGSLVDAFDKLDVNIRANVTAEDLRAPSGLQTNTEIGASQQVQFNYGGLGIQAGAGVTVGGNATFTLNPDIHLKKDGLFAPLDFTMKVSPSLATSLTFAAQAGAQISYAANKSYEFKSMCVWIGYVPICITPAVDFSAKAIGTASGSFSTTLNLGIDGEFGIQRVGGQFSPVYSADPWASLDVSVDAALGVTLIAPKMEVSFMLYSVAGPYVDIGVESSLTGQAGVTSYVNSEGFACYGAGVETKTSVAAVANAGLKANKNLTTLLGLDSNSASFEVLNKELFQRTWPRGVGCTRPGGQTEGPAPVGYDVPVGPGSGDSGDIM